MKTYVIAVTNAINHGEIDGEWRALMGTEQPDGYATPKTRDEIEYRQTVARMKREAGNVFDGLRPASHVERWND